MEMEKVGWKEEEEEEGWVGDGRRPESDEGDAAGRWEKQKCRRREVDREEQGEKDVAVKLEGGRVEQVVDRLGYFELQKEGMGQRGKHRLQAEGKMLVDLWQAGRKMQMTERREARVLRGEC